MKYPSVILTENFGKVICFTCPDKQSKQFFDVCSTNELRSAAIDTHAPIMPHRHDFYQLILCLDGAGIHLLDFNEYDICKGRCFFCAPEQCHSAKNASTIIEGYGIMFNDDFLTELDSNLVHEIKYDFFRRYGKVPYLDIPPSYLKELIEIIHLMQEECKNKEEYKHSSYCLHLLALFFIKLRRLSLTQEGGDMPIDNTEKKLLCQFIDLVEKHFKEKLSMFYYAHELKCSESKLNRVCRNILKESPLKIINRRKLDEAKRMLSFSQETIKAIALELGFPSQPYFIAFFKKHMGICPNDFRDKMQIKHS